MKNSKGITLIALVITIIILIILAGVSVSLVLDENGIVRKAKEAKENMQIAQKEEEQLLANIVESMNDVLTNTVQKEKSEIEKYRESGIYMLSEITLKDSDGNLIKVPQGFKIAEDSGKNVTEGIVIEDNDIKEGIGNNRGNQYVWIPVGEKVKKADGTIVNIELGRYSFADGENDKASDGTTVLEKGTPILMQSADEYTKEVLIGGYRKELAQSRIGETPTNNRLKHTNTTALNLKGFIDSAKANGGYYIARYEASCGIDGKANSKVSDTFIDEHVALTLEEGKLWNNIKQIDSATASRNLYAIINSDLINSYAWDTAVVYIQKFSDNTDYSVEKAKNINVELNNTGANKDELCKINDMASNASEWTTEYSNTINNAVANPYATPCTFRGGYADSEYYTTIRGSANAEGGNKNIGFRVMLYL